MLSKHLSLVLNDPEVKKQIRADAAVERDISGEAFKDYTVRDIEQYRKVATPELLKQIRQ